MAVVKQKRPHKAIIQPLNFGIFYGHCMFACGFEADDILKITSKWKGDRADWHKCLVVNDDIHASKYVAMHRELNGKHYYYIIYKPHFRFTDDDYLRLAHEVLHICQFYLPDVLDRNREIEAEAYLHTHLMQQCLTHIRNAK